MAVEIKYLADENELRELASQAIAQPVVNQSNKPVLLLLSGGSSFSLLPYLQYFLFDHDVQGSNFYDWDGDERFDEQHNNFVTLKRRIRRIYKTALIMV